MSTSLEAASAQTTQELVAEVEQQAVEHAGDSAQQWAYKAGIYRNRYEESVRKVARLEQQLTDLADAEHDDYGLFREELLEAVQVRFTDSVGAIHQGHSERLSEAEADSPVTVRIGKSLEPEVVPVVVTATFSRDDHEAELEFVLLSVRRGRMPEFVADYAVNVIG